MVEMDIIVRCLEDSPVPVTRSKLLKELRARERWTERQAAAHLAEAVEAGAAVEWPKFHGPRYWRRAPASLVREEILAIAASEALAKDKLIRAAVRRAHHPGAKLAESALRDLLKEGLLYRQKLLGPALYFRSDHPETFAEASFQAVREGLRRFGISEPTERTAAPRPTPDGAVLAGIVRLQPSPGVPVTVASLRAAIGGLSKAAFDSAVLALADQQRIYLTTHDHGWALPEADREQLVWDGGQKLYVAVTLRD